MAVAGDQGADGGDGLLPAAGRCPGLCESCRWNIAASLMEVVKLIQLHEVNP